MERLYSKFKRDAKFTYLLCFRQQNKNYTFPHLRSKWYCFLYHFYSTFMLIKLCFLVFLKCNLTQQRLQITQQI